MSAGRPKCSAARSEGPDRRTGSQAAQIARPVVERGLVSYECLDMEAYRAGLKAVKGEAVREEEDGVALWVPDPNEAMKT